MSSEGLGSRIRRLRQKEGLTISECAERLGVSQSTFRDWEYGRAIQGEPYVNLARLLRVSLVELMTGLGPVKGTKVLQGINEIEERLIELRTAVLSMF